MSSDAAKRYWNDPNALYGIIHWHRLEMKRRRRHGEDLSWFKQDIARLEARLNELHRRRAA